MPVTFNIDPDRIDKRHRPVTGSHHTVDFTRLAEKLHKYKSINEESKQSIFISCEQQIVLNKMIDAIFNYDNTTTSVMNDNLKNIKT